MKMNYNSYFLPDFFSLSFWIASGLPDVALFNQERYALENLFVFQLYNFRNLIWMNFFYFMYKSGYSFAC